MTRTAESEIEAERRYLTGARDALGRMHAEVLATETPEHTSPDSDEVWFNTMYRLARARRRNDLIDLPDVPLFFGRLDYEPGTVREALTGAAGEERVYVGRRHVRDEAGTPLVVDWRAPVSVPFYRATPADPLRVRLRRRYGFSDTAQLTAYEDEPLTDPAAGGDSELVAAEIERPRSGPMRDIVATIQPEQDDPVRAPLHPSLCVQGAPGTGNPNPGNRHTFTLHRSRA